jgi:hypothetical protein
LNLSEYLFQANTALRAACSSIKFLVLRIWLLLCYLRLTLPCLALPCLAWYWTDDWKFSANTVPFIGFICTLVFMKFLLLSTSTSRNRTVSAVYRSVVNLTVAFKPFRWLMTGIVMWQYGACIIYIS